MLPFRFVAPRLASLLTCLLLHRSATIPVHIRQSPFQRLPRLVMPRVCVSAHLPPRAPRCGRLRGSGRIGAPTPLCRGAVAHLPALRLNGCFQRLPRIGRRHRARDEVRERPPAHIRTAAFQRLPRLVMPQTAASRSLPLLRRVADVLEGDRIGAPTPLSRRGAVAHLPALHLDGRFQRLPRIGAPTSCWRRSALMLMPAHMRMVALSASLGE